MAEWVLDGQFFDPLPVLQVFGVQGPASGVEGGGNDQAVVEGELMAPKEFQGPEGQRLVQ